MPKKKPALPPVMALAAKAATLVPPERRPCRGDCEICKCSAPKPDNWHNHLYDEEETIG